MIEPNDDLEALESMRKPWKREIEALHGRIARLEAELKEQRELWLLALPDLDYQASAQFQVPFSKLWQPIERIDRVCKDDCV